MRTVLNQLQDHVLPRIVGALFTVVVFCAPLAVLTWCFDIIDELRLRILLNAMSGAVLVAMALAEPRSWRARLQSLWFPAFFVFIFLLFAIGHEFGISALAINVAIVIATVPWCWLLWLLMGRSWLLFSAMVSAVAVTLLYWVAAMVEAGAPWDIALLPFPTVLLGGVLWAPVARITLDSARRRKNRLLAGPGLQALAMAILFLPVVLVAVVVPEMVGLDPHWSAVSLTLVGVLLSTVISEPLRRFLLRWGNLSPDQ